MRSPYFKLLVLYLSSQDIPEVRGRGSPGEYLGLDPGDARSPRDLRHDKPCVQEKTQQRRREHRTHSRQ